MALTISQLNDIRSDMESGKMIPKSLKDRDIDYPVKDAREEMVS